VLDCSEIEYLMGVAEREPGLRATGHEVDPLAFRDHRQAVARHAHVRHPSPSFAVGVHLDHTSADANSLVTSC